MGLRDTVKDWLKDVKNLKLKILFVQKDWLLKT